MGSATTAVAALKSERKFVGYEIDKEYIKLSEQRLHSLLAQTKFVFEPTPIYKKNKKAKIKLELAKWFFSIIPQNIRANSNDSIL